MGYNPTAPEVAISLDRERHLRFDFNAVRYFEKETGKNLMASGVLTNLSGTDMVVLLWACLRHEDKDLTIDDVGGMVHFGNIGLVSGALAEMYAANVPKPEAGARPQ